MTLAVPPPANLASQTLGEAALTWAGSEWSVFPIVPRGKTPYATGEFCGRSDDHLCGFHCATMDRRQLAEWWTAHPDSNIGLSAPNAFVVDEDRIGALTEHGVSLPRCPWAITGRANGGRHFFLRAPADWDGLRGDDVKVTYKLAGVEVKGFDKGYVVAAPSIHATGAVYQQKLGGYVPEVPGPVIGQLVDVTETGRPRVTSLITVAAGGYEIPASVDEGSRYKEVARYTAHLYNRGLTLEEMWPLVQTQLAPVFTTKLTTPELRERFRNATTGMEKRLGERRSLTTEAVPPLALEDSPLTEFDSMPVEWLWPAWLPRGVVTLMDGNPGVSKSTLVADLIARLTTGRPWPDGTPAALPPSRAMWITTEDDPGRVLRPRIEAAGGDASLVRFVTSEVVFPQAATAFQELLVQRASEPLGLALVILDPLFSHIDAKVKSIADADMRRGVMNPLNRAAEAADLSILVVRHFNKDTTASALNRGAGSLGGIVGAARAVWSATVDPEDETAETKAVGVAKLNYAKAPPAIRYRVVDRLPPGWVTGSVSGIEWLGPAAVSIGTMMTETNAVGDAVIGLADILAGGPVGATAVKNSMRSRGFGREAVNSAVARIRVVKAKVGMTGGWEWSLPEGYGSEGYGLSPSASSLSPSAEAPKDTGLSRATLDTSSASSKDTEGDSAGGLPAQLRAPARVREAEEPAAVVAVVAGDDPDGWVEPCNFYEDHRSAHRRTPVGWVCDICRKDTE